MSKKPVPVETVTLPPTYKTEGPKPSYPLETVTVVCSAKPLQILLFTDAS